MSGIDNAKKAMGWVPSNARPSCANCDHMRSGVMGSRISTSLHCIEGSFYTQRFAICDKYVPLQLTGGTPT